MVFTVLLPVIKLLMRNLFSRAVNHLGDEIPELVVFNADVFGSLFVSYCMQSAPSVWTTLEVMVADIVMMGLALRDIERGRAGLETLGSQVDDECANRQKFTSNVRDVIRKKRSRSIYLVHLATK
ncbi:hypothetical protein PR002_g28051 [Phytophthora rubi]|uniref:Uncharacterized protein n=2 Tax=Phytophthora rubi TaxID=129364 RepID=A0A6A3HEU9_9STRA|nr:hypothetical protein PR002_g28051 [Phytophthora rubi]